MILSLRVENVIRTTELVILFFVPSQANTYNVSWSCILTCLAWSLYWHCCLEEMVFWKEAKVQRPLVPGLSILDSLLSCLLILPLLCHRGLHSTRGETPTQSTDWVILDNSAIWCLLVKVTQPIRVFEPILLYSTNWTEDTIIPDTQFMPKWYFFVKPNNSNNQQIKLYKVM